MLQIKGYESTMEIQMTIVTDSIGVGGEAMELENMVEIGRGTSVG